MDKLRQSHGLDRNADTFFTLAQQLEAKDDLHQAATAYDRAFGLDSERQDIVQARMRLLDQLSVIDHGMVFRYIPAGTFLMGSKRGDPDEQPVHPVDLDHFWMADIPVSWATYCDLMEWEPAPHSIPKEEPPHRMAYFVLYESNKIRRQYCEDDTTEARDWHAHAPELLYSSGGKVITGDKIFGDVPRENPDRPWQYDSKPMVSVSWQAAEDLCRKLSSESTLYRLPTEAEWEKSARGGLINKTYPWGSEPPTADTCDFNHFGEFYIQRSRSYPPNHYGLHAMSGGIWEWTSDWYQSDYYGISPTHNPNGPLDGEEKVLRGGSWSDVADAVTVSYRNSRPSRHWFREEGQYGWGGHVSPNIGFRICRVNQDN